MVMIMPPANAAGMMATRPNAVPMNPPVMQQPPIVAPNAVGQPVAEGQNKLIGGIPGTINALNTLGAGQPYGATGGGLYK